MEQPRLCNGRFARPIDSERDHNRRKISHLQVESDKWYRAYKVLADANSALEREVRMLKEKLSKYERLQQLLNEYGC